MSFISKSLVFTHLENCDMFTWSNIIFQERMIPDRRYFFNFTYSTENSGEMKKCLQTLNQNIYTYLMDEEMEINVLAYFEPIRQHSVWDCMRVVIRNNSYKYIHTQCHLPLAKMVCECCLTLTLPNDTIVTSLFSDVILNWVETHTTWLWSTHFIGRLPQTNRFFRGAFVL